MQQIDEIINFLKENIEPLEDNVYGVGYRASVYLKDGTFLPCVLFRNPNAVVNLAIRRFKEEKGGNGIFSKSRGVGTPFPYLSRNRLKVKQLWAGRAFPQR